MKYRKGYKYQLAEDEVFKTKVIGYSIDTKFIRLTLVGILTAKSGYAWNGADVIPDLKKVLRGSCGHDAGYQLIREGLIPLSERPHIDLLLFDCCIEDGLTEVFANIVLEGVKDFGETAATNKNTYPVLTAP